MAISISGLIGCVPLMQYRARAVYDYGADCAAGTDPGKCPIGLASRSPDYRLGIVEFDDQGELYSNKQFEFVRSHIANASGDDARHDGKLVVVFVHGWFHNASPGDPNLVFFRSMLAVMAQDEEAVSNSEGRKPRAVEGVFVAWRGASTNLPLIKFVTFWNRKDTAHRIGERRATEAIISLRDAAYAGPSTTHDYPNRFILMGHSFGGALVYSATSQLIADHLLAPINPEVPRSPLADAVILFNPAFEAARIRHLLDTAAVLPNRLPTLSIFTSKTDAATGVAFPAARFINTLLENYRSNVPNPIRHGDVVSQRREDTRTVGHFDAFLTHDLVKAAPADTAGDKACSIKPELVTRSPAIAASQMPAPAAASPELAGKIKNAQDQLMDAYAASSEVLNFGETCLVARKDLVNRQLAVFNVSVDSDLWDGHGIDQTPDRVRLFLGFLEHFIPFAASADTIPPPADDSADMLDQPPLKALIQGVPSRQRQRRGFRF